MRLDDFDPNAIDIEDQRGGGGRMGLPLGGGGTIGCGTVVIALIGYFVFGINPVQLIGGLQQVQQQQQAPQTLPGQRGTTATESCTIDASSRQSCNALSSLNKTWGQIFSASGEQLARPKLVFYSQAGSSGCGAAQSAMGPFYCPQDKGIYLDTDFFRQMDQELGASGSFARDYVIAHEYGHHVQKITGTSDQVRRAQGRDPQNANRYSVLLELQADCFAGIWAARNRDRLEPGDMESGLNAAHQIGDDTLMKNAGQRVSPESFTHGTSAQRMEWLRKGMESGDPNACNTFG